MTIMTERTTPTETLLPPSFETLLRMVAEMHTPDGFKDCTIDTTGF